MNCPKCSGPTSVLDSRMSKTGRVRRRRQCDKGHRFTTLEVTMDEWSAFEQMQVMIDAIREEVVK